MAGAFHRAYHWRMTEEEYFAQLSAAFEGKAAVGARTLGLADAAVNWYPGSARLWTLRGRLIQLAPEGSAYLLADAFASFQRAMEADPTYAEAYEEAGYYWHVMKGDAARAEALFRRAVAAGGGPKSYAGLAWALAELGRVEEALDFTRPPTCPHPNHPAVARTRADIEARRGM